MKKVIIAALCFSFLLPSTAQAKSKGTLKVLTLNTWGLPMPLGQKINERMSRIASAITDYDVVFLQETFDNKFKELPGISQFPYIHFPDHGHVGHLRSGLMTLSKYPIVEKKLKSFNHCLYPDCMAHKGILFTRIAHPQLGYVDLYNTHYQSRQGKAAKEVRSHADNALMQTMVLENHQYYPTILAGDFNFVPKGPEYLDLMKRLPLVDTFLAQKDLALGKKNKRFQDTIRFPYQSSKSWDRIDYIFALKNSPFEMGVKHSKVVFNTPYKGVYLSDHNGVSSVIQFTPKKGQR